MMASFQVEIAPPGQQSTIIPRPTHHCAGIPNSKNVIPFQLDDPEYSPDRIVR